MNINDVIIEKRTSLNLSNKELSDALELGCNGEAILRAIERGEMIPGEDVKNKIYSFTKTVYIYMLNYSTVKANDSAEAERIVINKYQSKVRDVCIVYVRQRD